FQTISHEAFNFLADLFLSLPVLPSLASAGPESKIKNKKKSVPEFLIRDHLTPRGLAFWFMDDGGKLDYNKNSKNKSIVFNTQSFSESEVLCMVKELSDKFNLSCEVRSNKGKKIIVVKSSSFSNFFELIDPYIIAEMRHKLPK
uniref:LAGLIDADG homing endonuclease n=1 Tax=Elmerina hispida TaxID=1245649 RepID=UPI0030033BCE